MQFGVIFGGVSYEHEISIVSAIALKDIIEAEFIFIDKKRDFYLIDKSKLKSKLFSSGEYTKMPKLELKKGGFYQKGLLKEKRVEFDVAINLVHGGDGEDGKLASLLEFFAIPYIGPRIEGSVVSYNKLLTKLYLYHLGINTLDFQLLHKEKIEPLKFDYPVIIKPCHLGSSIGVSVVRDESELSYALDVAFEFDNEVIIEPFIEGVKEYNLAGCKAGNFYLSKIEEPVKGEFLDFEKKYLDFGRTEEVKEAELVPGIREQMIESFKKLYEPLFYGAIIRVDFFVHRGQVYVNEINAVPGSLANYLFEDFLTPLQALARNLPKPRAIPIDYHYINSIQSAKK
ncbi:D-alanine--D-alanine ligase [Nitratiruptor tergarcus]|uniref:D-alanine--D-alanine ligase n=1 Tax=Nitratiruptor tergarcus DSM 16512 TaxID=1069081 RepID=A0A1W1WUK9_9BACT|nr:D-alanine--D-alanine ligase [Nitratiruptor tergarcus]SMC09882.1 D-alanine-D-alanine ligase [Nitratiruptor tergarcus DSM 16512]